MPVTGSGALDVLTAAELMGCTSHGSTEVLGALDGHPLLVIDLDAGGVGETGLVVPPLLPCVVVGISRTATPAAPTDGVDVAVAAADAPGVPWVAVDDLGSAVRDLEAAVRHSPTASVTLVHVLRSGRPDSLEHDLLLESLAYSTLQGGAEFHRWLSTRPSAPPPEPTPVREERALVVAREGARLSLTLNRPRVRNAYSTALRDELCEAIAVACADPSIEEVHLHGGGPDFCSGGDLSEFGTLVDPAAAHLVRTSRSAARLLGIAGERVTVHLHGACVGAGVELAALARRVVAEADTRLQLPEVAMGLIPGAGGTAALPRRIGRHRTAWLALTGRAIDAGTAQAWGLVDEVVGA